MLGLSRTSHWKVMDPGYKYSKWFAQRRTQLGPIGISLRVCWGQNSLISDKKLTSKSLRIQDPRIPLRMVPLNRWKGMKNWIIHNLWIIALRADYSRMRCAAACITTHTFLSSTSIFVRSNIATWSTSRPWKCSISDSHRCRRAFHRLSTETLS